ncbi:MAG: hypothetical protein IKA02_01355, partial [Clostridia bacterium]|nr:hypothetical protein [Clostridia bacterium]
VVVTVNNQSSVYGEDIKTITGNVTGGSIVNNDTNVYTLKTNATKTSNVGKYDVSVVVNNTNYTVSLANNEQAYEIVKADLTLNSVNGYNGIYDGKQHSGSVSIASVNNQKITYKYTVDGQTYNTLPTFENVGTYVVNFVASAPNHNAYDGSFEVNITPKEVVINWTENNFVYNGNEQTVEAWYSDVNGTKVDLTVTMNKTFKDAGNDYVATVSFANGETNYVLPSVVTESYEIKKLEVSIVANSFEIVKGETIPTLTWEYEQDSNEFIDADNVEVILNTEATQDSLEGDYGITFTEIANDNYEVTYTNGVLTVTESEII